MPENVDTFNLPLKRKYRPTTDRFLNLMNSLLNTPSVMIRIFCCVFFLLSTAFELLALEHEGHRSGDVQENREFQIGLRYGHGMLLPHASELHYLEAGRFQSVEISYMRRLSGREKWHSLYNFPASGFLISLTNAGHSRKLGYLFILAKTIEFPLWTPHQNSSINTRLTGGVAYLQSPFDPEKNPRNLAIGTNLNVFVQGSLEYVYSFSDYWSFSTGLQFNHFSNGSYLKPNKGVNYLMMSLGVHKKFRPTNRIQHDHHPLIGRSWNALLSGSLNSPHISSDSQYGVVTLGLFHKRGMGPKLFWLIGAEAIYNAANRRGELVRRGESPGRSINFQGGAYVGLGLQFGPNSISLSKGYLMGSKNIPTEGIYHRVAFRRELTENMFIHSGICSNYFKASFLDIGLGYKFGFN